MMNRKSDIVIKDGQEFVETEDHTYALGLQLPPTRTLAFDTLATRFTLLSKEEIKRRVQSPDFHFGLSLFDSSYITNQNGFGSCAAYAASSALCKARVLGGQPRQDLSGDYLYSLVNGGRDRGSMLDENMRAITTKGVCKRETVPLGGIYRRKYDSGVADREALRFRAHEAFATPDEISVATALVLGIPVVIAIHVTNRWRRFDGDDILAPCNGPGNHSEHLDDIKWSAKRGCFLFRKCTSHGKSYSDDGYCWTTWADHYRQSSKYHMFYGVPAAIEDPQGDWSQDDRDSDRDSEPIDTGSIVMQSSGGCVWCERWDENERPKVEAAGYAITEGSVPGSGVPRFTLSVAGKTKTQIGYWKFDDIERAAAELR